MSPVPLVLRSGCEAASPWPAFLLSRLAWAVVFSVAAVAGPVSGFGQAASGSLLEGNVLDPAGQSVARATVSVEAATGIVAASAQTDDGGRFRLVIPPGRIQVVVAKLGFATQRITLPDAERRSVLVIRLSLSEMATQVTVSAEAQRVDPAGLVPQRVNLIEASELRRRGYWNLASAAAEEAGVAVQQTSPSIGGIYIRGMGGDDVPVFLDGVRVTTSAARGGINTFFNLNDTSTMEGVELLRGPNTAQYGSDSLGGVVSLRSRNTPLSAAGAQNRGTWGTGYESATHAFGSDASWSHSRERVGLVASLFAKRVNTLRPGRGLDSRSALTRFLGLPSTELYERIPDSAFTQYGGAIHGQWAASATGQLVFHYQRSQQDAGKRPDQLLSGDGNFVADLRNLMADLGYLRYHAFPDRWIDHISITGSFLAQREERRNQGGQGTTQAAIRSEFERASVWGTSAVLGRHRGSGYQLVFGGDSYLETLRAQGTSLDPVTGESDLFRARLPDRVRYHHMGAFLQMAWTPFSGRLRVSGALRTHRASYRVRGDEAPLVAGVPLFADDRLTARNVSGRLGAVYSLGAGFRLRAYYARGFRAPTATNLGTLGLTGNGYEVGKAELAGLGATVGSSAGDDARDTRVPVEQLKPELSDNFDAGLSWETGRVRLDLTGFLLDRRDVIAKRALILPPGALGTMLGDQPVSGQDVSGLVYVPLVPNPVLVRTNAGAVRFRGIENAFRLQLARSWILSSTASYVHAADRDTGLPPDISSGVPAPNLTVGLRYLAPTGRFWVEAVADGNLRQNRLSSVGLTDRRVGATRSRDSIARYFANGAIVQGLIDPGPDGRFKTPDDLLRATGEWLPQVQGRVLGGAESAPLYAALPGYLLLHLRGGLSLGETDSLLLGVENITDRNYRGMAWGLDGRGRTLTIQWQHRF